MATVVQLRQRLELLRNRDYIYGIFFEVVKRFEAYLVDFNQIRLEEGQDIFGNVFGRYSRTSELEYLFGNPKPVKPKIAGQPYNFQWTGGLFQGMKIEIFSDRAEFTSTDSKTPELVAKYKDMFGLQKEDFEEALQNKLFPEFMILLRKQLGYDL